MNLYDLDTPALLVDLDILEQNISRMAAVAREGAKRLRPHIKTHKTPEIARMQRAAGAQGLTAAKLGEAEVMADAGFEDIFIANQIVGAAKVDRLISLAQRARIIVGADNIQPVEAISAAAVDAGIEIGVRIEVDTGLRRAGVRTMEQAMDLAASIRYAPGIRLDGVFTYEGHANAGGTEERAAACRAAAAHLNEIADGIRGRGIEVDSVSVGSTAGAPIMAAEPGITELRPGVYVFNDCGQMKRGAAPEQCALTVLATVVSRPESDVAVLDSGTKALSGDKGQEGSIHGRVIEDPSILFDWANEEHGHLDLRQAELRPAVGAKLRVIPFHACTATNMHDTIYAIRGEQVEAVWSIAARGRIQ